MGQLRVGVIGRTGAGNYGHQLHLAFTRDPRASIVAVADPDEDGGREALRATGAEVWYPDYELMLKEQQPDVVVVAPREMDCHEDMVLAAFESGAHVYCEKPVAQSLEQADRMVAAGDAADRRFAVALPASHEARFEQVRTALDDGTLGDLLHVRGLCKWDHRGGGQDFLILGVHFADMMRRLAGDPTRCTARVSVGNRPIEARDVEAGPEQSGLIAGDRIWAAYDFPGQVVGTIESWRCGIDDRGLQPYRLEILGTKGTMLLRAPYGDHSLWFCDQPAFMPGRSEWTSFPTRPYDTYAQYHQDAAIDFLDAIEEGRDPRCSGRDGLAALEMIHAAYAAQLGGGSTELPLSGRQHPLEELVGR